MSVPMAMRHIKPGAAHLASDFLCRYPHLLDFMPASLPRSRTWLRLVNNARLGDDFGRWLARNAAQLPSRFEEAHAFASDIADWVKAGQPPETDEPAWAAPAGRESVVRPFAPSMSLRTVTRLSLEWHETVARNMSGPQFVFPAPWYLAATVGDYEIVPIEISTELYREGAAMHHCVATLAPDVMCGRLYVYSVRRKGERVATLSLSRTDQKDSRASLDQLRGKCNARPPKEMFTAVRKWLRTQKTPLPPLPMRPSRPVPEAPAFCPF